MKHSDRPILRPKEDVLGRASFSLFLARAIDNLSIAKDGFVIAVTGEWGAGKSSVVEMASRFLTHLEMERASQGETLNSLENFAETFDAIRGKVAEFDLLDRDFSMARRAYRRDLFRSWLGNDNAAHEAEIYYDLLLSIQSKPRTLQVRFSPWLISGRAELANAFLSELARALGDKLGSEVKDSFARLLERLSELAPLAGAGLDLAAGTGLGKLLSSGATLSNKLAVKLTSSLTLDDLRERLRLSLRALSNQRVLVIIDDLDRLTPSEAVEMVSLVKSLGDLPNVIYLLSFDQKNLTKLISESSKLDGGDYLGKIVQYPVSLPPLLGDALSRLLDADITEILGNLSATDQNRLSLTWYFVFRHYLKTPRHIRLYANSITVSAASQKDFVDPIDMLLLELLRLHETDLYTWLRDNLDELTE